MQCNGNAKKIGEKKNSDNVKMNEKKSLMASVTEKVKYGKYTLGVSFCCIYSTHFLVPQDTH